MARVHWTGHPFVDAGLAALAAKAGVRNLEELSPQHLRLAVDELKRILLSDQSLGIGVSKSFAKSQLSQLFPNSELVNPSNWKGSSAEEKAANVRRKFDEAIEADLARAQQCLQSDGGEEVCFCCGEQRPKEAMVTVRRDKLPLLVGIVNFYPAFDYGPRICGLCALAVRFLPCSVMRTGASNRLWFLHTQALPIVTKIAQTYGWQHFDRAIAANEPLDFFGAWETAGNAGTALYLLCNLLEQFGEQLRAIYLNPLPTVAYLFSNDNRQSYVQALPIPNALLIFFAKLQLTSPSAFRRFRQELLQVPENLVGDRRKDRVQFVQSVANRLVQGESLVGMSLDNETPKLVGGWVGHRLYLQEVRKMPANKLAILERLGKTIAQSDDAKKHIMELRQADRGRLFPILLGYVRKEWLKHDELYFLLPPNDYEAANEVRDILLAVIYEWQYCQERGEEFPSPIAETPREPDEILLRIQQIGKRLCNQLPNLSRWIGQLQTARTSGGIRKAYLSAVQKGAMGFNDFAFLVPFGDRQRLWLLRDYLLAFLFEQAREVLPEEEEISVGEERIEPEA